MNSIDVMCDVRGSNPQHIAQKTNRLAAAPCIKKMRMSKIDIENGFTELCSQYHFCPPSCLNLSIIHESTSSESERLDYF